MGSNIVYGLNPLEVKTQALAIRKFISQLTELKYRNLKLADLIMTTQNTKPDSGF